MSKDRQERLQHWAPYAVTPVLMLAVLQAMGLSAWVTLTVAGLTMGMMLFLVASGLTLIFGLMEVLNFAHAAFVTVGAYVTVSVLRPLGGWTADPSLTLNLVALLVALIAAAAASGALGYVFERVIIRQVYGAPLRQILITIGALTVDYAQHQVTMNGREVELTPIEYRLLAYLAQNAGRIVTQDLLLEHVWGAEYVGESHLLQVNINRLRRKLEPDAVHPRYIQTKTGVGYLLNAQPAAAV